jgi:hypothetical protein
MSPIWNIEVRECGVWETRDTATSLADAIALAQSLIPNVREEWIRIVTPEGVIL